MLAVGDYVMIETPTVGGTDLARVTGFRFTDVMVARRVLRQQRMVLLAVDSSAPRLRLTMSLASVLTLPQARLGRAS